MQHRLIFWETEVADLLSDSNHESECTNTQWL